jgi:sortase A
MIIAGLAGAAWALFELRPTMPEQDEAIVLPAPSASTPPESDAGAPAEPEVEIPSEPEPTRILYPEWPALGDKVGTITLPTLDLSWPIFEGTSEAQLSQGVGHFVGSVLPGIRDNSVLSGHRTTVFNRLGELTEGDLIFVSTSAGEFTYQVRGFQVVSRSSREIIVPTPTAVLTLTTCYPFNQIGRTTDAFIVTADLVESRYRDG